MLPFVIQYRLDAASFVALSLGAIALVHRWLRAGGHGGLRPAAWAGFVTLVGLAAVLSQWAGDREAARMRDRLEGIAPTYAQEVELMGHARLTLDTPPDDPTYLALIAAEIRWERANRNVTDVYTYRRTPEGKVAFVVDSETDYDRNGRYEGDRESRTALGEIYPQATANLERALDGVASFDDRPYADRWGTWVSAYVPLHDADGRVEGALGVDYDAKLWNTDIALTRLGMLAVVGLPLAIGVAALALVTVSRSELKKRDRLQRQLVDASRQAGMAEVATGVLHDVGNVLNSVNVSAGVLGETLRDSKLNGLGRAVGMIREHRDGFADFIANDAKGKLLPDYLIKLSDLLAGEHASMETEVSQLSRSIGHIKRIVASQQTLAKSVDVLETFEPGELIEEALRIGAPDSERQGVRVDYGPFACPPITADRHLVLQVLVNLVSNAVKAMADGPEKVLTVTMEPVDGPDGPTVRIAVRDNGVGIPAANLPQLFTHGFTTRVDGHGFGLHHSAIVAHNLAGRLVAASDGVGHGATFTLTLPRTSPAKGVPCPTA